MPIEVLKATPDDAEAIAALQVAGVKAAFSEILPKELLDAGTLDFRTRQWRGWLERSKTFTFATRDEETLTGFCSLHPAPESGSNATVAEIAALYVLPSYWREGLGRALGERGVTEARDRGFEQVVAWEFEGNLAAKELGAKLGFELGDQRRAFLEGAHGDVFEVQYRLDLSGQAVDSEP